LLVAAICPSKEKNGDFDILPPDGGSGTGTATATATATATSMQSDATASTTAVESDSTEDSGTADQTSSSSDALPLSCDDIICRGNGGCQQIGGVPKCVCNKGYVLDTAEQECIVDETCINFRFLEPECRQSYGAEPAVALFFGVDFCAGTAVTPAKLAELQETKGIRFRVMEDDVDILDNIESSHALLPKPVESYVTILLDVSKSVTGDDSDGTPPAIELDGLIGELRKLVGSLEPVAGEARVFVSLWVFARGSAEYVPFTNDYDELDSALVAIQEGQGFLPTSLGIYGSDLYDASIKSIEATDRIKNLRRNVTKRGVLSTGTVVVITDGNDTSGMTASKLESTVKGTLNQVMAIGISERADKAVLDKIGRDGSFLAPTPEDWTEGFAEITDRVKNYPARSYLLGYCSSKTVGKQEVTITMGADEGTPLKVTGASCEYDADEFSSDGSVSCDASYWTGECDSKSCGGLSACGGCSDDECCSNSTCISPTSFEPCNSQNDRCHATDQICDYLPGETSDMQRCIDAPTTGQPCMTYCKLGESYCYRADGVGAKDPGVCVGVYELGDQANCTDGLQCAELNCTKRNPNSDSDPLQCLPLAVLYNFCGPKGSAICENGGYCTSSHCAPRKWIRESCSRGADCETGTCVNDGNGNRCVENDVPACYFSWDEKVMLK
jgi:hypothetical protein